MVCTHSRERRLHTLICLSEAPLKILSLRCTATECTMASCSWPWNTCRHLPEVKLHTRTVESELPLTRKPPSWELARAHTGPTCSSRVSMHLISVLVCGNRSECECCLCGCDLSGRWSWWWPGGLRASGSGGEIWMGGPWMRCEMGGGASDSGTAAAAALKRRSSFCVSLSSLRVSSRVCEG